MRFFWIAATAISICLQISFAQAQEIELAFGGLQHDASLPVEISADQLKIDQSDGSASFTGNVLIGQGDLRLSAGKVLVQYAAPEDSATGQVSMLLASGGVTLVTGNEAIEAKSAEYSIIDATIVLDGNVILTQGRNALSAERMTVNLNTGLAVMEGRVRTIFQTGDN